MGPTASGKTELAVTLVKHLPCDIISVDSAMVYRGMDIGTAKPTPDILAQAPHRLIDIRDPSETYSAAQFRHDALIEIQKIQATGRIPLLVGGTGLYFRTLQYGLSELPTANPQIRHDLNHKAATVGWAALHQRLAEIDPRAAQRIHPNDAQRIQRALEVYEITGMAMTDWFAQTTQSIWSTPVIKIILAPIHRHPYHAKIANRFHAMLAQGLIEEVRQLFKRQELTLDLPSLRAVGYRQVWRYLNGEIKESELAEQGIIATRQLAKRQLTWLRAETDAQWFDTQSGTIEQQVLKHLGRHLPNSINI